MAPDFLRYVFVFLNISDITSEVVRVVGKGRNEVTAIFLFKQNTIYRSS
jgi:hypothetical protein